jgi:phosphocarrier protein HPr
VSSDRGAMNSSSTNEQTAERMVEIRNPDGLHMRPAMQFVERANGFQSRITITKGALCVDGKSIMQVSMLAATRGTQLKVMAVGPDALEAIDILADLLGGAPTGNTG